jgi:hypothetical protein
VTRWTRHVLCVQPVHCVQPAEHIVHIVQAVQPTVQAVQPVQPALHPKQVLVQLQVQPHVGPQVAVHSVQVQPQVATVQVQPPLQPWLQTPQWVGIPLQTTAAGKTLIIRSVTLNVAKVSS